MLRKALTLLLCVIGIIGASVVGYRYLPPYLAQMHEAQQLKQQNDAFVLLRQQSIDARSAIKSGDFTRVEKIFQEVVAKSSVADWGYEPFDYFLGFFHDNEGWYITALNKWADSHSGTDVAYLLRARYYQEKAVAARGTSTQSVSEAGMRQYTDYMRQAALDAHKSIDINPKIPVAYLMLIQSAKPAGVDETTRKTFFEASIKRFPEYYPLYSTQLAYLAPQWGGGIGKQVQFVYKYTYYLPENSALKFLGFELSHALADDLSGYCIAGDLTDDDKGECQNIIIDLLQGSEGSKMLQELLKLYNSHDHYAFNEMLLRQFPCECASSSISAFALVGALEPLGNHNYALNTLLGYSNESGGTYSDALEWYMAALEAMKQFPFPDESNKNARMASLLDHISTILIKLQRYEDAVNYSSQAIGLSDHMAKYYEHRCTAYMQLKKYKEALEDCNASLKLSPSDNVKKQRQTILSNLGT